MDSSSLPASPLPGAVGTPLREMTADRLNKQQRDSMLSFRGAEARDSSVHDKINVFNSLAMQSKTLERKTADAALKRAMLGREEAESEMRRYREEVRGLRRQVEDGRERERRVGERLETVMENYGRAKETHAHTQALWEKEIRRARKETFKSQSTIVKLQEELKSARTSQKSTEESLDREKERSRAREQEAFQARYSLVGLQEQLDQALEQLRMAEQERDAFKTLAKNEEDVARIASEGRLPLPRAEDGHDGDDEFASPVKKSRVSSINLLDVKSSATSEAEIEELTRLWQWERQRAQRTTEHLEFLQLECELKCCPCVRSHAQVQPQPQPSATAPSSARQRRLEPLKIADAGDLPILSETDTTSPSDLLVVKGGPSPIGKSKTEMLKQRTTRTSTVFMPKEGVFRTVSQQEAEAMETEEAVGVETRVDVQVDVEVTVETETQAQRHPSPVFVEETSTGMSDELLLASEELPAEEEEDKEHRHYARTPSVDPPSFALIKDQRTSLLSLLDAPQRAHHPALAMEIPTTPGSLPLAGNGPAHTEEAIDGETTPTNFSQVRRGGEEDDTLRGNAIASECAQQPDTEPDIEPEREAEREAEREPERDPDTEPEREPEMVAEPSARPHTTAGFYAAASYSSSTTITTTTKVPLREENTDPNLATRLLALQRTPSAGSKARRPNMTVTTPARSEAPPSQAITPTMTREQALAQIQERRGRARSAAQGTTAVTPKKPMLTGPGGAASERRDLSAPAARSARRVRS